MAELVPVSPREFAASERREVPEPEQVAEGVWTLPMTNKKGHMPFTFSYLLRDADGDVHVIDPGWDFEANLRAVERAVERIGSRRPGPATVTCTHFHPDHMGLAETLRREHGTVVLMHPREARIQHMYAEWGTSEDLIGQDLTRWGVPDDRRDEVLDYALNTPRVAVDPDRVVEDGEALPVPGHDLRVLHTPGHTLGHLCVVDEDRRLLFAGDHVLPGVVPGLGAPGSYPENPLESYLLSLRGMSAYEDYEVLPGHEYRYRRITARVGQIVGHYRTRTTEVGEVLAGNPDATPWEVGAQLTWSRGWAALTRHYLVSALRQTAMHMALIRSGRDAEVYGQA